MPLRSRFLVATQLPHRLRLPHVQQRGRLRLHHHQRNPVHKQHQVRLHHPLIVFQAPPLVAPTHPELRRHQELVQPALRVLEVEEPRNPALPAAGRGRAHRLSVDQVLVHSLIPRNPAALGVLQFPDHPLRLRLRHPLVQS